MLHNNYTQDDYCSYSVILPADPQLSTGELILGDLNAATDAELMREHNVKTIITAASGLEHLQIPPEQTHIVFPLLDLKTEHIENYFELSYNTIEESTPPSPRSQKRVSPRPLRRRHLPSNSLPTQSATLVIAYYMKKYSLAFAPAIKHVRSCRNNICPNLGFELQLKHYQTLLKEKEKDPPKKTESKQTQYLEGKHLHFLETKQMLLTFQGTEPPTRTTHHKTFGQFTPALSRKNPQSTNKRVPAVDLLVRGQEVKPEGHGRWGRRDNSRSFKF